MSKSVAINPWAPDKWNIPPNCDPSSLPKVTIGILNYNRKDDLRRTLDCIVRGVTYPDLEIIVVDNASTDSSAKMVQEEFPVVRVIHLEKNIGSAGRNYFYVEATGKYIFSFDDDSFPATPSTILNAIKIFQQDPELDSLTLFCYQPLTGFTETGESQEISLSNEKQVLFFAEGAMCIKASSWRKIKGYDIDFFWGAEGVDLSMQMYGLNMRSMYHPGIGALHMKSEQNRNSSANYYFFTRNYIWSLSKHLPLYTLLPIIVLYVLRKIIALITHPRYGTAYIRGIFDGMIGIPSQRKKCKKFNLRQVLSLKRWFILLLRW